MRTGPTNPMLTNLIEELKALYRKENVGLWKRIAKDLSMATRSRRKVNIKKIDIYTKENETVIVPGKVLGDGSLGHKVNVAAWSFSKTAEEKINKIGKTMSIPQLMKDNPKGRDIRILG